MRLHNAKLGQELFEPFPIIALALAALVYAIHTREWLIWRVSEIDQVFHRHSQPADAFLDSLCCLAGEIQAQVAFSFGRLRVETRAGGSLDARLVADPWNRRWITSPPPTGNSAWRGYKRILAKELQNDGVGHFRPMPSFFQRVVLENYSSSLNRF